MLKNLILLSGFSTFAVIVIIGFNIYHNNTISSLPEVTQERVLNIPSTFDEQTIESLRTRKSIEVNITDKTTVVSEDSKNASTNPISLPEDLNREQASSSATPL